MIRTIAGLLVALLLVGSARAQTIGPPFTSQSFVNPTFTGTISGSPAVSGTWTFQNPLIGGASLDLPLTGGNVTGPVSFGANAVSGSNFAISGGSVSNTPISATTLAASSTVSGAGITALLAPYAPLASPTFTGTPAAPTAAAGTATTQLASTGFVSGVAKQGQFLGTATNDNATAGNIGEFISATIAQGSAIGFANATLSNVTSISLTAGDWDVWGSVGIVPAGSTLTQSLSGWISTTSVTLPTAPNGGAEFSLNLVQNAGAGALLPVGITRLSLSATTTVYLEMEATFTTSTNTVYGFIGARRVR